MSRIRNSSSTTKRYGVFIVVTVLLLQVCACTPPPESAKGFRLPDGDAQKGAEVFAELGCVSCHHLQDSILPFTGPDEPIILGGEITKVKTYGELVTSIINPSHKVDPNLAENVHRFGDESRMDYVNLNQAMTVQELIDLVAFLQGKYKVVPPDIDYYSNF